MPNGTGQATRTEGPHSDTDHIGPGVHQLLNVCLRALQASEVNLSIVEGILRVLLRRDVPLDSDCRLLASVVADATGVSHE